MAKTILKKKLSWRLQLTQFQDFNNFSQDISAGNTALKGTNSSQPLSWSSGIIPQMIT